MMFPVIVHKDSRSAFGVTIPDIPGCFTAGRTLDEALRRVQEAVEVHLEGADDAPVPSPVDHWASHPDFRDGLFALVNIDFGFLEDVTVRVNITARKSALAHIDRVAKARGEDRSEFLIRAALERAGNIATEKRAGYGSPRSLGKPAKRRRGARRPAAKR